MVDSLSVGGAEVLLKNTLPLLDQETNIVCYLQARHELRPAFSQYRVYCLHHERYSDIPRTVRRLKKIIHDHKVDLVHSHLFWSTLVARLAVPASVALVSTIHSVYSIDAFQKNKKALIAERLSVRKRHNIIAVSDFVLKDYLKCVRFKGRTFVLYDFLPDSYFAKGHHRNDHTDPLKCVAVGNLKEAKNYHYLLRIFSLLRNENLTLDIYGRGDQKELQEIIEKENLRVQLRGEVAGTQDLLKGFDLFIQASSHEGFGLSVIEAIATRLPVFVSDIPVLEEVTGGYANFFPLTDVEMAAQQLRSIKHDPELRYQYVDAAYQFANDNFTERRFISGLRNIYSEVLDKSRKMGINTKLLKNVSTEGGKN